MTAKPETQFYQRIHKHFGSNPPFSQKTFNPLAAGIPDMYYSGQKGDLWVEYKFDPRAGFGARFVKPNLSARQNQWLMGRYHEGRRVAVIMGGPGNRAVIYEAGQWTVPLAPSYWQQRSTPEREVAQWILNITGPRYVVPAELSEPEADLPEE